MRNSGCSISHRVTLFSLPLLQCPLWCLLRNYVRLWSHQLRQLVERMSWHGQQWWVSIICSARSTFSCQLAMHFTHTSLRLQHIILVLVLILALHVQNDLIFFGTTTYFGSWSRLHRWIVIPYKLRSSKPSLLHLNLRQCYKVSCTSSFLTYIWNTYIIYVWWK